MAVKFRVTRTHWCFDMATATNDAMEDLIDIYGFLGEWRNPTHILVAVGSDFWAIPMDELEVHLVDENVGGGSPKNLDLEPHVASVWFTYVGSDHAFIDEMVRIYKPEQKKITATNSETTSGAVNQ